MDYQKIYNQIIERAKSENRVKTNQIYYEAHHIIPKCLGGEGECRHWKWHPNIVLLTAKEHFISHMLLHKIHPKNKDLFDSLWLFCNGSNKKYRKNLRVSSRLFSEMRQKKAENWRNNLTGVPKKTSSINKMIETRKNNDNYKHTKQTIIKISKATSGENNGMFNKKHTEESLKKQRESKLGEKNPMFGIPINLGIRYVNNGNAQLRINIDLLDHYLNLGWIKGRLKK